MQHYHTYMSNFNYNQFKWNVLQVNFVIFFNDRAISSIFPYKDIIPDDMKSNIVYKYEFIMPVYRISSIYYATYYVKNCDAKYRGISSLTGNFLSSSNKRKKFPITLKLIVKIHPTTSKLFKNRRKYLHSYIFKPTLNGLVCSS